MNYLWFLFLKDRSIAEKIILTRSSSHSIMLPIAVTFMKNNDFMKKQWLHEKAMKGRSSRRNLPHRKLPGDERCVDGVLWIHPGAVHRTNLTRTVERGAEPFSVGEQMFSRLQLGRPLYGRSIGRMPVLPEAGCVSSLWKKVVTRNWRDSDRPFVKRGGFFVFLYSHIAAQAIWKKKRKEETRCRFMKNW